MDLNDDLCRTDFFDFVKLENGSNGLTPVAFLDSFEYPQTDPNNNLSTNGGNIKTILDEMLLSDPLSGNPDALLSNRQASLELLGSMPWVSPQTTQLDTSVTNSNPSSDRSPGWLLNSGPPSEGEVTTLTNLLDPLFVTYDDPKLDPYFTANSTTDLGAISSDLITTTFVNDNSTSPGNSSETEITSWQKGSEVFCDESLLRSALQAGNGTNGAKTTIFNQLLSPIPTTVVTMAQKINEQTPLNTASHGMTELRKVLSFPPMGSVNSNGQHPPDSSIISTGSPTSTDQLLTTINNPHTNLSTDTLGATPPEGQYYELKVFDTAFVEPDTVIPKVEELIMARITPQFNTNNNSVTSTNDNSNKKGIEISEKKINSTTFSAKWTYTTNMDQNKTPRKRNRKSGVKLESADNNNNNGALSSTVNCDNQKSLGAKVVSSLLPSHNNNGSSPIRTNQTNPNTNSTGANGGNASGAVSRKERSLHYCNICCKGFKDKYSVNVHVRTHTGEKPFSCTLCGKNFRQKAHLAKHYQTHAAKANNPHGKGNKRIITVPSS